MTMYMYYAHEMIYDMRKVQAANADDKMCCVSTTKEDFKLQDILRATCPKGHDGLTSSHCNKIPTVPNNKTFLIEKTWKPPATDPTLLIVLSVFGKNPIYVNGMAPNVLLAREVFPNWTVRFYVDDTVQKNTSRRCWNWEPRCTL